MPNASLVSAPANDIAASPRCGLAAHPRRTAMPIAPAVSTPNPLITPENTMEAGWRREGFDAPALLRGHRGEARPRGVAGGLLARGVRRLRAARGVGARAAGELL